MRWRTCRGRAGDQLAADAPQAEPTAEITNSGREIERTKPAVEAKTAWPEARAEMSADIDPAALTVMAEADADMTAISSS